jgi:hypothetical protein
MSTPILREVGYFALHLCYVLWCLLYELSVLFAYRLFYPFFSPATKAYLDHEYQVVSHHPETLLRHLRNPYMLFTCAVAVKPISYMRFARTDTPFAAFLRIVRIIHNLPDDQRLNISLEYEVQQFWHRGMADSSKPDHFLFGGKWHIKDLPDPRKALGNKPLLCAIAASTAEHMVELFNWRIGLGIRRDMKRLSVRKPDKNLTPCPMESVPGWCKDVGPAPVQTIVGRQRGKYTAKKMLELNNLSPSFKKRNLLAISQFMYFS